MCVNLCDDLCSFYGTHKASELEKVKRFCKTCMQVVRLANDFQVLSV